MDAQQLVSEFLNSGHGAQAAQALSAQGFGDDQVQQLLTQAATAAHEHVEEQGGGLMGAQPGKSFFAAFAAGLVKGDGFLGSLLDGGEGVLSGRVTQAVADRLGIDPATASTVAAAATPYLVSFLKEKMG